MGKLALKMQPLFDRILVKRDEGTNTTKGGLIIPDTAKEKPKRGTVVAVGPGNLTANGERIPLEVQVGDVVIFTPYAGSEVETEAGTFLVLNQIDVLAVMR